ncbi:MAG: hypothetical protein KF869_04330 [Phycisphaeraceae bacterium]|nr:hypothetical protein [Phycisphaeraceae bacterium]
MIDPPDRKGSVAPFKPRRQEEEDVRHADARLIINVRASLAAEPGRHFFAAPTPGCGIG